MAGDTHHGSWEPTALGSRLLRDLIWGHDNWSAYTDGVFPDDTQGPGGKLERRSDLSERELTTYTHAEDWYRSILMAVNDECAPDLVARTCGTRLALRLAGFVS